MKNTFKIVFALVFLMAWGCDKQNFADLNSDPSTIPNPDLRFSVTTAIDQMYSNDYTTWFYNNFQYIYPWAQVTTMQGGNNSDFVNMGASGGFDLYGKLFTQTLDVRSLLIKWPRLKNQPIRQ